MPHSKRSSKLPIPLCMASLDNTVLPVVNDNDTQVRWTTEDEKAMIEYLVNNKIHAGDSCNFKDTIWNEVAALLEARRIEGGVKTVKKCKGKWQRVSDAYDNY